jgi:hypothetical protein
MIRHNRLYIAELHFELPQIEENSSPMLTMIAMVEKDGICKEL